MSESIRTSSPIVNFFMDPVSNARVALPSQSTIESPENYRHDFFHKVVASSAPMGPQRCLVAAIVASREVRGIEARHDLALCRLTHTSWTIIKVAEVENHKLLFRDIEIIDRKLYAATKNFLMVFHIKDNEGDRSFSYKLVETVKLQSDKVYKPVTWPCYGDGPYLVKDATSKELFMVVRDVTLLRSLPIKYRTKGFRVFKLENCIASRWVEVSDDLGDRILFLSKFSNQLIYSGNGDSGSGDKTVLLERNCILFAFKWPRVMLPGGDFGVFSLINKRVIPLTFPEDQCPAVLFEGNTAWFNPNA